MADTQTLKRFNIEKAGDGFRLDLEDESGKTFQVIATHDQMDVVTDRLEELLDADEEAEVVEDEGSNED